MVSVDRLRVGGRGGGIDTSVGRVVIAVGVEASAEVEMQTLLGIHLRDLVSDWRKNLILSGELSRRGKTDVGGRKEFGGGQSVGVHTTTLRHGKNALSVQEAGYEMGGPV